MRQFALLLLLSGLPLAGCSVLPADNQSVVEPERTPYAKTDPLQLIATDFTAALSQLKIVAPMSTTVDIQRSDRNDQFTLAMVSALQHAGYGVRWINNQDTMTLFQYRQVQDQAAAATQLDTYELAVGVVEMRRGYATDSRQRVRPVTPLYVRGTDATGLVLNDRIFEPSARDNGGATDKPMPLDTPDQQIARVNAVPLKPLARQIQSTASPSLGLQNPSSLKVPNDANPLNPLVGRAASAPSVTLPLVDLPRAENVFDLGGSNFQDMLSGRAVVDERILTFANDSMRLGSINKRVVEKMVAAFNPKTDVFSVIGCSMGPTQVKGGNAALALGRAGRVVEALRFAGVNDKKILDEGCWAGDGTIDELPRRGVVLTLNRKA